MENAAKALIIAGGILIAILILSLLVYAFSTNRKMAMQQEKIRLAEQAAEFNSGYQAYNKKVMYGADVISVINKAAEYNKDITDSDYKIKIIVNGEEVPEIEEDRKVTINSIGKTSVFECIRVAYSEKTERISLMEFKQRIDITP